MEAAWEDLLQMLSRRDLSAAEAQQALVLKGHAKTNALRAVRRARRLGLLDDTRVAQSVVDGGAQGVRHGALRIAADLSRRGVDERLARQALSGLDDAARCKEALSAYLARRGRPEGQRELRRLLSFLVRQGYTEESVRTALAGEGIDLPDGAA